MSSDGNNIATDIAIPNTSGWQVWTDVIIPDVVLESGEQILRLTIGATDYVNLNYVSFSLHETPIETIQLKQGWNLVGYPYSGEKPIEEALASIWEHIETVKDFSAFYDVSSAPQFNLLTHIEFGKGYYIYVNEACELEWGE